MDILTSGVCHTDLHYKLGGISDDFPFLLGHEATGVVSAVGPDVTDVAPPATASSSTGGQSAVTVVLATAAKPVLLQHPQRHPKNDPRRRHGTLARLGIGAFTEKTLVAAGQCTKVDPDADAPLSGCSAAASWQAWVRH